MRMFEAIKQTITAEQAAVRYANLEVKRKGAHAWACCPFHADNTPSMMFDEKGRFYCFSCNAGGSAIDFVAQYFKIDTIEAAKRIANDLRIESESEKPLQRQPQKDNKRDQLRRLVCEAKLAAHAYHAGRTEQEGESALDDEKVMAAILLEERANNEWLDILESGTEQEAAELVEELEAAMGA